MVYYRGWPRKYEAVWEREDTKYYEVHHYIEMERFRQQQGHIDIEIRTLEREYNWLNDSGQNPERVQEIENELSRMYEQAEDCREQIEDHMDMHHAYSNYHLEQAMLAKQKTKELVQAKNELLAKQEQLRQEGNTAEADSVNNKIEQLDERIRERKAETEEHREKFHENQKKTMKNAKTIALYDEFRLEAKEGGAKTHVDNDGRVIQAILEMDAKQVFGYLAANKATVCFYNEETLDLLINKQLPVHPRTIKQLYETPEDSKSPSPASPKIFRDILNLTKNFNDHRKKSSDFRKKEGKILQDHRMCTLKEVNAWKQDINDVLADSIADQRLFENMTPAEAFRLKTVMDFNGMPHDNFKTAKMAAGLCLAKDLNLYGNIFGTADCIEVIDKYVNDMADSVKNWEGKLKGTADDTSVSEALSILIRGKCGITDNTWQYTSVQEWKLEYIKRLGQINSSVYESMVTELRSDMQDVENLCRYAPHRFGSKLSATYHFRKHHRDALVQHFKMETAIPKDLTREQKLEIYFKKVPNVLFAADNRISFSQNGLTIRNRWDLDTGYFGIKSKPYIPYTEHFGNTIGSVTTHYNIK